MTMHNSLEFLGRSLYVHDIFLYLAIVLGAVAGALLGRARGFRAGAVFSAVIILHFFALIFSRHATPLFDRDFVPYMIVFMPLCVLVYYMIVGRLFHMDGLKLSIAGLGAMSVFVALTHVGCLFAGCSTGIEYNGSLAVIYPPGSESLVYNTPLFPVAALESLLFFIVSALIALSKKSSLSDKSVYLLAWCGFGLALFGPIHLWYMPESASLFRRYAYVVTSIVLALGIPAILIINHMKNRGGNYEKERG